MIGVLLSALLFMILAQSTPASSAAARVQFANMSGQAVRSFDFTYTIEIPSIPEGAKKVAIWLPYPVSDAHQQISDVKISTPFKMMKEGTYGNSIAYVTVDNPQERTLEIDMSLHVLRQEYVRHDFASVGKTSTRSGDTEAKRFLSPDKLVPSDSFVKNLAKEVTRGKKSDLDKARAIYEHVVSTMKYDKTGTGWGRGDFYYACNAKKGNCTDFHALFIGLCRAVGIPARFSIGFPIPAQRGQGDVTGYHCWAEFYLKGYGWVPVDASEASKNPSKKDYFFGAHDENRVQFTTGRDIVLDPPQAGGPLNYFVYPYIEVDGKPFDGFQKKFAYRDANPSAKTT